MSPYQTPGTLYNEAQFSTSGNKSPLMAKVIADRKLSYTLAEKLDIVRQAYEQQWYYCR
jgi:hypothetical protein